MTQDHAREQAKAQLESIRFMLAALECDYDRLDELQEEYDGLKDDLEASEDTKDPQELASAITALADFEEHELPELKELLEAAGDCKSRNDAEQVIQEDPLSVEVRTDWYTPSEENVTPSEFCILLCTGGPAVRIRGDLDEDGCPTSAYMQYQDWGTPWSAYYEDGVGDACLEYAQNFYFGG